VTWRRKPPSPFFCPHKAHHLLELSPSPVKMQQQLQPQQQMDEGNERDEDDYAWAALDDDVMESFQVFPATFEAALAGTAAEGVIQNPTLPLDSFLLELLPPDLLPDLLHPPSLAEKEGK